MNTDLISLAARYSKEMHYTAIQNKHIAAIEEVLCRSPKYNPHKSGFRYMYGILRGTISGHRNMVHPGWLLCFGYEY